MENQHRMIRGYRDLSQEEILLMNDVKAMGEMIERLGGRIRRHLDEQRTTANDEAKVRIEIAEPGRWLAIGKTHVQEGLMAMTRAIAQPTSF